MQNELVLIVATVDMSLLALVRSLGAAGVRGLHVFVENERPGAVRFSRYVDRVDCGFASGETMVEAVAARIRNAVPGRVLVMPVDEAAHRLIAAASGDLPEAAEVVPIAPTETYALATHKRRLAGWMAARGIPCPRTFPVLESGTLEGVEFPVVVKPSCAGGGWGISCCRTRDELAEEASERVERGQDFVVQELVTGSDMGCNLFAVGGSLVVAVVQRDLEKAGPFSPPSVVEICEEPRVLEVVERLVRELEWTGVAHVDLRFREGDRGLPLVLEINARYWASLMASTTAGVNIPAAVVSFVRGARVAKPAVRYQRFRSGWGVWALLRGKLRWGESVLAHAWKDPLPELLGIWGSRALGYLRFRRG